MHTASASKVFHAPVADVWAVLDDFGGVWKYHPGVEQSRPLTDSDTGEGAVRECVLDDGARIEETIVDYAFGERYTVELTDTGPFPLASNQVTVAVDAVDAHHTRVTATARFRPKFGPAGWLLAKLSMERAFETRLQSMLDGLAGYLRGGTLAAAPVDASAD